MRRIGFAVLLSSAAAATACEEAAAATAADAAAPDCTKDAFAPGCPCLEGEHLACYDAPPATEDVGPCHGGELECVSAQWSSCRGAVLPRAEECNGEDDDCDGQLDEGVVSPCGGCNRDCLGAVWGPPLSPFAPGPEFEVLGSGELTLPTRAHAASSVWAANTDEGTLSRVDAERAVELARYRTAGGRPVAVAPDHRGDVWVLDARAGEQGLLTKVAGARERCRDRGGDGLKTSSGFADVLAFGEDDCVLASIPVGAAGDEPRTLAIDGALGPDAEPSGHLWVGLLAAQAVVELDGDSGVELQRVALPGHEPFASAFDSLGRLWVLDRAGRLARVQPESSPPTVTVYESPFACFALDDLAIDSRGRLALTGFSCETVSTFDPTTGRFREAKAPSVLTPRGVAVRGDELWVSYTSGQLGRYLREPLQATDTFELAQGALLPFETTTLAVDGFGQLWAQSASGGPSGVGVLTRFDPDTGAVSAQVPVGVGPRGRGDLTGAALQGDSAGSAQLSQVFEGCGHESLRTDEDLSRRPTRYTNVHLSAVAGRGASVVVEARWAPKPALLAQASYERVGVFPQAGPVFPLDLPEGGVLELRLTLVAGEAIGAPRVARIGVEWVCVGPD